MAANQRHQIVRTSCGADDFGTPAGMLCGDDEGTPPAAWFCVSPTFDRPRKQRRGQHDQYTIPQLRGVIRFAHVVQQRCGTQGRVGIVGANGAQDSNGVKLIRAAHAPKGI